MEKINFENLPSTNTPINATNLNQLQTNVENAISGVIESGSNSNGNWVKWEDGTMICRMTKEGSLTFGSFGNLFHNYFTDINFPQTFIASPHCFAQNNGSNNIITGECKNITTSKIGSIDVWHALSTTTYVNLKILAIGRWK